MPPSVPPDAKTFVKRLLTVSGRGQELGDPRSPGAIASWSEVCEGFPDEDLKNMIPTAIRLLFRKEESAARLTACGLRSGLTLQHESIAPYVIAFRRLKVLKRGGTLDAERLLAETRRELRELNARFQQALEEAITLRDENQVLRDDLITARTETVKAKAESERYRKEAQTARNVLDDASGRALNKLALALQNLRDVLNIRVNDPESTLVESAALSVQSYYMVLEDLGHGNDALKLSQRILGDKFSITGLV
ncbi:MAG: hypothetical protein ABT940_11965 [Alphaproteobacteria bacterium]